MHSLHEILKVIDSHLGGSPWFIYFLLATGLFFTVYLRFPQIRFFSHAFRIVRGKYDKKGQPGDTSHFRALTTALSGTVGTGNIAGVAYALHLGGPAALFWMMVTAAFGMATKFVEVTLSHKYREKFSDGTMAGGPMYYMKNASFTLGKRKFNLKPLGIVFSITMMISAIGAGNLPQINSISHSVEATFGLTKWVTGLLLTVPLALVILGGIKRISLVTSRLVPVMASFYLLGSFFVLFQHAENILPSLGSIFTNVFSGTAATGGFLGASIAFAFQKGVGRGLFSNEAGQGSAPIAHAAARADEPVSEGIVSILEPFIDTILICMLTGLTLLSSGVWKEKHAQDFQRGEIVVLDRLYEDSNEEDQEKLFGHISRKKLLPTFTGDIRVVEGKIQQDLSLLHARSIAEDVSILEKKDGAFYTGLIPVVDGKISSTEGILIKGSSLMHSAPLTNEAFTRSILGKWGSYVVTIGLLLFAFSTAISWSYYGDRGTSFLINSPRAVVYYRIIFVLAFFVGSFVETTFIWTLASIGIVLTTIPNLIGILWLSKDMRGSISSYGKDFKKEFPDEKSPSF
ncbi:MAG: sodium:alanine symporter family protein [Cytophagales bacterium]|nr:sodium:alanine symporter family protein [Cytophagales bacterium]